VRVYEARQTEWSQVNLAARLIRLEEEQTKTEEAGVIPLPSVLCAMLRDIKPKNGRAFSDLNLRTEWEKACEACGLGQTNEDANQRKRTVSRGINIAGF